MLQKLEPHKKNLGEFVVSRYLPQAKQKMVGPFIFFDHLASVDFEPGQGINVRPHPHIGLSTITYLFEGSILHRDSLGNSQEIFPGDVNWMTAGSGIVHSERETHEVRDSKHSLRALQTWVALPEDKKDIDPNFVHVGKEDLPCIYEEGKRIRLIAGEAYGEKSPLKTYADMFYLDAILEQDSVLDLPFDDSEVAVFIISGQIEVGSDSFGQDDFVVVNDKTMEIRAKTYARVMILGGKKFERQPLIDWNFVAWSKEEIEAAKQRWKQGEFPSVPGDDREYIPLPK